MHSINQSPVKRQRPQRLLVRMLRVLHSFQRITRPQDLPRRAGITESEEQRASRLALADHLDRVGGGAIAAALPSSAAFCFDHPLQSR
jgi:hypothetical protein